MPTTQTAQKRTIKQIAKDIKKDWGTKVNPAAKPFLEALLTLEKRTDMYVSETADSIILYFLANASGYRGDTAKKLKAELKQL
jgi:hypothetical protein